MLQIDDKNVRISPELLNELRVKLTEVLIEVVGKTMGDPYIEIQQSLHDPTVFIVSGEFYGTPSNYK